MEKERETPSSAYSGTLVRVRVRVRGRIRVRVRVRVRVQPLLRSDLVAVGCWLPG